MHPRLRRGRDAGKQLVSTWYELEYDSIALNTISDINDTNEAIIDWKYVTSLLISLKDSGLTVFSMDTTMISKLNIIANKQPINDAIIHARNILRLVFGMEFELEEYSVPEARLMNNSSQPISSSIINDGNHKFKVYPNPANDFIYIASNLIDGSAFEIELIDISGRVLNKISLVLDSEELKYNVKGFSSGLYFLRIKSDVDFETFKIVIK